ncbi:CinA family protein [Campylobacter sp. FMV-PI01]|uniref:CinA family protein n=1 Tax=Campylobacter portucalensis TaxID=2608384 RepID=A0A6L5WJV7_9BACT|nr:CinA family protein [Campylobacter portucalensis]MSN96527.1 CinA family protein [Campylobacter portucalensis]
MKNLLLIISSSIKINQPFLDYIFKSYIENFGNLDDIKFIEKINLKQNLEFCISNYSQITIITDNSTHYLTNKILATINEDLLILNEFDDLIPQNSLNYQKNSILIDIKGVKINLIKATPLNLLPKFLIQNKNKTTTFFIYDNNPIEIKNLKNKFQIDIISTKYSNFITKFQAKELKFGYLDGFINEIKSNFKTAIFSDDLVNFIVKKLKKHNAKITFAESYTAGLLTSEFSKTSDFSEIFDGSLVVYSKQIKHTWLDIEDEILNKFGAISIECVEQMLDGALRASGASFAIAISGVDDFSAKDEIKSIIVGVANFDNKIIKKFHINTNIYFKKEVVNIAISLLIELCRDIFFDDNLHYFTKN